LRTANRDAVYLLPPSAGDRLPKTRLVRFAVDVVEGPVLSAITRSHRSGGGSASCRPSVMLGLMIHGCATGACSSRKLERATDDSVAVRFVEANRHTAHDMIAVFRKRFREQVEGLFVQVSCFARESGMPLPGTVALDGTKGHADASRPRALSWERACEPERRLKAEVAELLEGAESTDTENLPDELSVPW